MRTGALKIKEDVDEELTRLDGVVVNLNPVEKTLLIQGIETHHKRTLLKLNSEGVEIRRGQKFIRFDDLYVGERVVTGAKTVGPFVKLAFFIVGLP